MNPLIGDIIVDCVLLIGCVIMLIQLLSDRPDKEARKNKKMNEKIKKAEEANYKKCMDSVRMKKFDDFKNINKLWE